MYETVYERLIGGKRAKRGIQLVWLNSMFVLMVCEFTNADSRETRTCTCGMWLIYSEITSTKYLRFKLIMKKTNKI